MDNMLKWYIEKLKFFISISEKDLLELLPQKVYNTVG